MNGSMSATCCSSNPTVASTARFSCGSKMWIHSSQFGVRGWTNGLVFLADEDVDAMTFSDEPDRDESSDGELSDSSDFGDWASICNGFCANAGNDRIIIADGKGRADSPTVTAGLCTPSCQASCGPHTQARASPSATFSAAKFAPYPSSRSAQRRRQPCVMAVATAPPVSDPPAPLQGHSSRPLKQTAEPTWTASLPSVPKPLASHPPTPSPHQSGVPQAQSPTAPACPRFTVGPKCAKPNLLRSITRRLRSSLRRVQQSKRALRKRHSLHRESMFPSMISLSPGACAAYPAPLPQRHSTAWEAYTQKLTEICGDPSRLPEAADAPRGIVLLWQGTVANNCVGAVKRKAENMWQWANRR